MITHIFRSSKKTSPSESCPQVEIVAGSGIVGERHFGLNEEPGQNVTFIEGEELDAFADEYGAPFDHASTGRNIVTRGIRLNALEGRTFSVGGIWFRGVELCEPCRTLGATLKQGPWTSAAVIKRWTHRAGLRADALSSGVLSVGDGFVVPDEAPQLDRSE